MLRKIVAACLLWLVAIIPASAGINNPGSAGGSSGAIGISQLNLGGGDINASNVTNLFKVGGSVNLTTNSPSVLDADGYPVQNLSGLISYSIGSFDCTAGTQTCVISWPATRTSWMGNFLGANASNCVSVNATVTNCSGSGNFTITPTGGAGSVTFNFGSVSSQTFRWDNTGTYAAGSGEVSLVRSGDIARYQAAKYWTTGFESTLTTARWRALRTMGWTETGAGQSSNLVKYAYRPKTTNFSWKADQYPPSAWSSSITVAGSGAGTMGQYTAAPATDTPLSGWVSNEFLLGSLPAGATSISISNAVSNAGKVQLTVNDSSPLIAGQSVRINLIAGTTEANTTTTILTVDSATLVTINVPFVHAYVSGGLLAYQTLTVTGKTGGAKFILSNTACPLGGACFGSNLTVGPSNFYYDGVLDAVLYNSGGVNGGPPLEAQAQLTNDTGTELWYCFPEWAEDDYVTQASTLLLGSVNANVNFEYTNEPFNFQFVATQWMKQRGDALGITGSSASGLPFYALRVRQIMGNLIPSSAKRQRLYMFQAGTGAGDTSVSSRMSGSDLVSPGNATYQAFVGGSAVNYNTSPNRPVDFIEGDGYAPYMCGLGLAGQSTDCGSSAPSSFDLASLQIIGDNEIAGNTAVSRAKIDDLTRQGRNRVQTVTASGTTFTTPLAHNFSVGDHIRFSVSGGTAYAGLNLQVMYQVLTTSSTSCPGAVVCNFTAAPWLNGNSTGIAVNAGAAGSGTTDVGATGNNISHSIFNIANGEYTKWQNMAATAFSPAPALGTPKTKQYEGGIESTAPTTAQATAIGLVTPSVPVNITGTTHGTTTVDAVSSVTGLYVGMVLSATDISASQTISSINTGCTAPCFVMSAVASGSNVGESITASGTAALASSTIASAITGWKNDTMAAATIQSYYKAFMGTEANYLTFGAMPNSASPSQLVLCGNNIWAIIASCTTGTTPYQTYFGIKAFNTNWLLKRDLEPTSNDNDPMWLDKAA